MEERKGGGGGGGKYVPCALTCIVKAAMSDTTGMFLFMLSG